MEKEKYPLGLALSGGSIKGFAHLGVLQYLEENHLQPDIIAGTSAGSIMGAFYAAGYAPQEIFEIFSQGGFMQMTRLTIGGGGLFSTTNFLKHLRRNLPYKHLEDLPRPMRIVATDLDAGEQYLLRDLWLRSSSPLVRYLSSSSLWRSMGTPMSMGGYFGTSP